MPSRHSTGSFPTRRTYLLLAGAFIAFAIYASLIPFELRRISLADAWTTFQDALATSPERVSRSDALANTLMFCPIGFALMGSLLTDRTSRWPLLWCPFVILPISLAASFTAEFVQTFTPDRVPTRIDIMSQTAGCIIGMVVWTVAGMPLTRWMRSTIAAAPEDRFRRVLIAYTAAWVFINLAPFDFTFDLGDLGDRVRTGRITLVPFSGSRVPATRLAWDIVAEILSAIPLGLAAAVGWKATERRAPTTAFALGTLLIAVVETTQLFIRSHSATITDVIFGSIGVAIGVWSARWLARGAPSATRSPDIRVWWPAVAALVVWCCILALYHWQPYDFAIDRERIREKLGDISLVPFAGYADGRWLNALNDMLTKLSLSIPFGVIASFAVRQRIGLKHLTLLLWMVVAACVFGTLEFGQLFISIRSPDPTDVLTGTVGTVAGLAMGRWVSIRKPG